MEQTKCIHIAPNIGYLFPAEAGTASVLCGKLAKDVLNSGEWIGVAGNLNPNCPVCPECSKLLEKV